MNLQQQIDKNTILHYVEDYRQDDEGNPSYYELSFSFYDCHYYATVSREDIDNGIPSVGLEGDSRLFDSFNELCENDLWSLIKRSAINMTFGIRI